MLQRFSWDAGGAKLKSRLLAPVTLAMSRGVCGPKPVQMSAAEALPAPPNMTEIVIATVAKAAFRMAFPPYRPFTLTLVDSETPIKTNFSLAILPGFRKKAYRLLAESHDLLRSSRDFPCMIAANRSIDDDSPTPHRERRRSGARFTVSSVRDILEFFPGLACCCEGGIVRAMNSRGLRLLGYAETDCLSGLEFDELLAKDYRGHWVP